MQADVNAVIQSAAAAAAADAGGSGVPPAADQGQGRCREGWTPLMVVEAACKRKAVAEAANGPAKKEDGAKGEDAEPKEQADDNNEAAAAENTALRMSILSQIW